MCSSEKRKRDSTIHADGRDEQGGSRGGGGESSPSAERAGLVIGVGGGKRGRKFEITGERREEQQREGGKGENVKCFHSASKLEQRHKLGIMCAERRSG